MRLVWLRNAYAHSQKQWAAALGVLPSVLNKWEMGTRSPNLDILVAIIDATGATADYVLLGLLTEQMKLELAAWLWEHHPDELRCTAALGHLLQQRAAGLPAPVFPQRPPRNPLFVM